jgi:hypothetical protein
MKSFLQHSLLCTVLLATAPVFAQETAAPKEKPMGRLEIERVTMSAEVVSVNLTNREVTLKGPEGNTVTFTAGEAVKRLAEIKPGDFVRADYYTSVAAELRKPTEEEAKNPLVIMDAAARTGKDEAPAGGTVRRFKVVTTIEALDRRTQTVTVKGPLGRYLTAKVADPERLTKVRIGQNIVIVYTEALVISLDKVDNKAGK